MKKGYYISAFVSLGELQNIMDIKLRHDQTIALWYFDGNNDVKLVRYWELERITGYKQHTKAFFNKEAFFSFLEEILKEEKIFKEDIQAIWGTRGIETDTKYRDFFQSTDIAYHSIAHLMTSIYYDNKNPFDDTIISLNLDAGPDSQFEKDAYNKNYYAGCVIKEGDINIFPIESPARLWSYSFKKFGLREGTLMALATAVNTSFPFDLSKFDNFKFYDESTRKTAKHIVDEISEYVYSLPLPNDIDTRFSEQDHRISAIMKLIVDLSQRIVCRNIDYILNKFGLISDNTILAMAGGFALNCPTNSYILDRYKFKSYQIPPCTSDTGIAAGVGISGFFANLYPKHFNIEFNTAYYGREALYDENILKRYSKYILSEKEVSLDEVANDIIENSVIVWVNKSSEIGPRALGNRSLIADPRTMISKNKLNDIKKRQWWRPVAPIIMHEHGPSFFKNYKYSPNMLLNFEAHDDVLDKVPAIMHFDKTSRAQSVSEISNPILHRLLNEFFKKTSVPILCNTSLNDAGEPIIDSLEEAILFALHKGIKSVYYNGNIQIKLKTDTDEFGKSFLLRDTTHFSTPKNILKEDIIKLENPNGLSIQELTYFYDNPKLFSEYNIKSVKDAEFIKKETHKYLQDKPDALQR